MYFISKLFILVYPARYSHFVGFCQILNFDGLHCLDCVRYNNSDWLLCGCLIDILSEKALTIHISRLMI